MFVDKQAYPTRVKLRMYDRNFRIVIKVIEKNCKSTENWNLLKKTEISQKFPRQM